jgi:hypothetical protein
MKTSNKMLLGLFALIVLAMLIVNIIYKIKIDKKREAKDKIETVISTDSTKNVADSLAMDSAVLNQ